MINTPPTVYWAGVLAALCLLGSVACTRTTETEGHSQAPKVLKLAFVTNSPSDFWRVARAGVKKYERESGVQVDVKMPPNAMPEEQNAILEDLLSQGYDAVGASVIAPVDQLAVLNRVAAKMPLITFDSDAPNSKRLLYIGTNNYEAGRVLGNEVVKLLPEGGKAAVFVGTLAADNAAQRLKGIEAALAGHPIEIVAKREDNSDRSKARSNVEDIINAYDDLRLVIGLWSYNGPAIAAAIEGLGKVGTVKAAVFDEELGTLQGIESGAIQFSVVQKPYDFGYLGSKWLHQLALGGEQAKVPASGLVDTGVEVISRSNVAEFKQKLSELTADEASTK